MTTIKALPEITDEAVAAVLRQSANFAGLDEAVIQRLTANKKLHHFNKGEFIYMDGDPTNAYLVVFRGMVRLFKQSPCGRIFTMTVMHAGNTLNDISIFNDTPAFVSAEVLKPTTVISIEREEFLSVVSGNPELMCNMMRTVASRVKSIMERLVYMMADKAERRVCKVILMLSAEYGAVVPFTHQDIADMAGVSRETASRAIIHLQSGGLIIPYRGSLKIVSLRKLAHLFDDGDI